MNDPLSEYIQMGMPKDLTSAQLARLNEITQDLAETDVVVRSAPEGTVEYTLPMNSNDIVLMTLT